MNEFSAASHPTAIHPHDTVARLAPQGRSNRPRLGPGRPRPGDGHAG